MTTYMVLIYTQWRRTYGCSGCTCTHSFPAPPRNYLHKCTPFSALPRSCTLYLHPCYFVQFGASEDMGALFNKRLKNLNKNLVPNKMYHYLMHIFIFPYPSSSLFLSLVLPQSESLAASIIFC